MDSGMQPFDWGRIFIGNASWLFLLEIVFRTCFMYVVAIGAAHIIGKRGMGDLTPFEYIVVIAMGATAGTPMMEMNIPLLHGVAVLLTVVTVDALLANLTRRSLRLERFLNTPPEIVIREGKVLTDKLHHEKIGLDELMMMLRMNGVRNVAEVEFAFLEPSGTLSVFFREDARFKDFAEASSASRGASAPGEEGESTMPKDPVKLENEVQ